MRHPGADEWPQLITEFERSDLEQKEFAAKHDLHLSTFQYWLYRTRSKARSKQLGIGSKSSPKFLPIQVVGSPAPKLARVASEQWVEAATRSGVTFRFAVGADVRYLSALFAAIG